MTLALDADANGNWVKVACEGEAVLRFYEADAIAPIKSTTSTGGAGVQIHDLGVGMSAGVNVADRYQIDTRGDHVVLVLRDWLTRSPPIGEPYMQGKVVFRGPWGEEAVDLEPDDEDRFWLLREWDGAGRYDLELDRFATHRYPLQGVLVGLRLQGEFGLPPEGQLALPANTPVDGCFTIRSQDVTDGGYTWVDPHPEGARECGV